MYQFKLDINPAPELLSLTIRLSDNSSGESRKIVRVVIESINQLSWFTENEYNIRNDKLPLDTIEGYSISQIIEHFYESVSDDIAGSNLVDEAYEYRSKHGVRFGFRGQDISDVYIGLNSSGEYEVSCSGNDDKYSYIVDIDSLFNQVKECLQS